MFWGDFFMMQCYFCSYVLYEKLSSSIWWTITKQVEEIHKLDFQQT